MSYCRWSTDDFQCDLYVYESCYGGYSVNVAGRRRVYHDPLPPEIDITVDIVGYCNRMNEVMRIPHDLVDIDLPYAGESFDIEDAADVVTFLDELKNIGYRFPDYVTEAIKEEIA